MKRRIVVIVLVVLVIIAWGAAYWYIGADAKFIWGLIKSGFRKPAPAQVVTNTNLTVVNTNVPSLNTNASAKRFVGFEQSVIASGLTKPTRMAFDPMTDHFFVSELGGRILRLEDDGSTIEVASGFNQLLGISFGVSDSFCEIFVSEKTECPALYVASRGTVSVFPRGFNGTFLKRIDLLTNLPAGRHQTDLALLGPDQRLYIATGSQSDRGEGGIDPREAAILTTSAYGTDFRTFATGLRNPYGMTFHEGKLYVTDNGQDVPANGVPDELNIVEEGKDYGWVGCWGVGQGPDCAGTEPPVALLQEHSSANGFAVYDGTNFPEEYRGNLFIALWGANSRDPDIGKRVVRVIRKETGLWDVEDFVTGLGNPIDVKVDPRDGSLLILDFGRGEVIRVRADYE